MLCHECDYRVTLPLLTHKQSAVCPRCGLQLTVYHHSASQRKFREGFVKGWNGELISY